MMKKNKSGLISILLCFAPMLLGMAVYSRMPERMAIHFDIHNQPNGYASKEMALFGIPIFMVLIQITLVVIFDYAERKTGEKPKLMSIITWFMPVITVVLYVTTLLASAGMNEYIGKIVLLVIGVYFILIGNYLPKMSYEAAIAMKQHPIPKDEKSYKKMTRILSCVIIILGIAFLIGMLFV